MISGGRSIENKDVSGNGSKIIEGRTLRPFVIDHGIDAQSTPFQINTRNIKNATQKMVFTGINTRHFSIFRIVFRVEHSSNLTLYAGCCEIIHEFYTWSLKTGLKRI